MCQSYAVLALCSIQETKDLLSKPQDGSRVGFLNLCGCLFLMRWSSSIESQYFSNVHNASNIYKKCLSYYEKIYNSPQAFEEVLKAWCDEIPEDLNAYLVFLRTVKLDVSSLNE